MRKLIVLPAGRLGNQMIQLIAANTISQISGDIPVHHPAYREWNIQKSKFYHFRVFESRLIAKLFPDRRVVLKGNEIPKIARREDIIILGGNALQIELMEPSKEFARNLFRKEYSCRCCVSAPLLKEISEYNVIHIRLGDIWEPNQKTARSYSVLPINYYEKIARLSKKPFLIVSERATPEQEEYIAQVMALSPGSTRINYGCPIRDFQLFRSATTLTLATSTFSWLAGWLSENNEELFVPNVGFFNNSVRPDIDLTSKLTNNWTLVELD